MREILDISKRSARAMETLVGDLLDHAKIENGRLQLNREDVDLRPVIEGLVKRFSLIANRKGVKLSSEFTLLLLSAEIDLARFDQIVSNLLSNAINFTPAGGRVALAVIRQSSRVVLSVKDDGPGLEPSMIDHVFDRYWQARKSAAQGTGLGLAIAKAIAEAHDGKIWVESELGKGSTFYVSLPSLAATAEGRQGSSASSSQRQLEV